MKPRKLAVIISVILYVLFFLITAIGYYIDLQVNRRSALNKIQACKLIEASYQISLSIFTLSLSFLLCP